MNSAGLSVKQTSSLRRCILLSFAFYCAAFFLNASRALIGNGLMPALLYEMLFISGYCFPVFTGIVIVTYIIYGKSRQASLPKEAGSAHRFWRSLRPYVSPVILFVVAIDLAWYRSSLLPFGSALFFCVFLAVTPFPRSRKKALGIMIVVGLVGGSYTVGLIGF